jgi:hypothetical protein
MNAGHGLVFGVIAVLSERWLGASRLTRSAWGRHLFAFGMAVVLGAGTEVLQLWIGRDADLGDLGRDALGAWAGLALVATIQNAVELRQRAAMAIAAVVPTLMLAAPAIECANAYLRRSAVFPVLADFDRVGDLYFVEAQSSSARRAELPRQWSMVPDEHALRVTFLQGPWPGVGFVEPAPNWAPYRELLIDVTNPNSDALALEFRVHDAKHDFSYEDRYNRSFVLEPQQRTVLAVLLDEIEHGPESRELDMTRIANFMLFVSTGKVSAAAGKELFISRIWLR